MHGKFPQILTDSVIGKKRPNFITMRIYCWINSLLKNGLTAVGTIGFWEAGAVAADTIEVRGTKSEVRLESLRQQIKKAADQPNLSLTDFIARKKQGKTDYIGAFSVNNQRN